MRLVLSLLVSHLYRPLATPAKNLERVDPIDKRAGITPSAITAAIITYSIIVEPEVSRATRPMLPNIGLSLTA